MPNRAEFAAGVLDLEGLQLPPGPWDWDVAPPPCLLNVLEVRTAHTVAELTAMLVPDSQTLLRPAERDAFCPLCHAEDLSTSHAPYQRRAWLDSWCLTCSSHGCVLGCFAGPEPAGTGSGFRSGRDARRCELKHLGRVHVFSPPQIEYCHGNGISVTNSSLAVGGWFVADLLSCSLGRRLMLAMGQEQGPRQIYSAIGILGRRWLDDDGNPARGEVFAPRAPLRQRLLAAMAASLVRGAVRRRPLGECRSPQP